MKRNSEDGIKLRTLIQGNLLNCPVGSNESIPYQVRRGRKGHKSSNIKGPWKLEKSRWQIFLQNLQKDQSPLNPSKISDVYSCGTINKPYICNSYSSNRVLISAFLDYDYQKRLLPLLHTSQYDDSSSASLQMQVIAEPL